MSRSMIGVCAVTLSAATLLAGAAAPAEPVRPTKTVTYADLNLSTDAGARELLKRLENAAWQVCSDVSFGRLDIEAYREFRDCRKEAVTAAVHSVGSERLAGVAAVKVRRPALKARLAKAN